MSHREHTPDERQWDITVRLVPYARLCEAALLQHAALQQHHRLGGKRGLEQQADHKAKQRWEVNYARHKLTDYDRLRKGLDEAQVRTLKSLVLDEIAATYPQLARECATQKKRLEEEKR